MSQEVPYGSKPEEMNSNEDNKDSKGPDNMLTYIAIGVGALLVVGAIAGFVFSRGSRSSNKKRDSEKAVAIELSHSNDVEWEPNPMN